MTKSLSHAQIGFFEAFNNSEDPLRIPACLNGSSPSGLAIYQISLESIVFLYAYILFLPWGQKGFCCVVSGPDQIPFFFFYPGLYK